MAKRKTPHEMNGGSALPSREAVQEFIRTQPTPVGKREIARHFGIKGDSRVALKRLLREMQIEGTVERKGKALANAGALPPVVLADVVTRDRDGDLVAKPTEWDEEDLGKPPRISVHFPRKPRPGMAAPESVTACCCGSSRTAKAVITVASSRCWRSRRPRSSVSTARCRLEADGSRRSTRNRSAERFRSR